jgi:hypothetical protein
MSNIPVNPTVLSLYLDLKDGAGKLYRLKVQTDGIVTFSLQEVTNEPILQEVTNEPIASNEPGPEVQCPIRNETVDLSLASSDDSSKDSEVDLTNTSDDCLSPVAKVQPSRSALNILRSAPANNNKNKNKHSTNPTAMKKPATGSRAPSTRGRVATNNPSRATNSSSSHYATTNRQPRATRNHRRSPDPIVFSSEEEDFETAPASQEFW